MTTLVQISDLNNLNENGFSLSKDLEKSIGTRIASHLSLPFKALPEGYHPEGDFEINSNIIEFKVSLTNDIFIEFFNYNQCSASGLSLTKAKYYLFLRIENSSRTGKKIAKVVAIKVDDLKKYMQSKSIINSDGKLGFFISFQDRRNKIIRDIFICDFGEVNTKNGKEHINIDQFDPFERGMIELANVLRDSEIKIA
jgi:hypothetical protein